MADIRIDTSEVKEYAVSLDRIPGELTRHAVPALKRAAQNVKTSMQDDFRGSSNAGFQKIAGKVAYDEPSGSGASFSTEVGIDKGGAGSLGNLAVYGSYKGGGTHDSPEEHAEREMPAFEAAIDQLIEGLIP